MIGKKVIKEKIRNFYRLQCKVHLTKMPTPKFPKGKFQNGFIIDVLKDKIIFLEDIEGRVEIFFFDISDIEQFNDRGDNV